MSVEIANESGVDADEAALVGIARYVLAELGVNPLAELSVLLVDGPSMATLHKRWMDEPGPTDVLAFPMDELDTARGPEEHEPGPALLGDVVLCPDVARDNARRAGHSVQDELQLLTAHGVLHLLGYDHAEPDEEREMFQLQSRLLDSWQRRRAERQSAPAAGEDRQG